MHQLYCPQTNERTDHAVTYDHIGGFPRKAALLHLNFAKLVLHSHVFRGLSVNDPIPHYLLDNTATAISSATNTIDLILTDPDASSVVVGMPSYLHCMTAFACMFLIKMAHKYGKDLIDPDQVWGMTMRLVHHYRSVPAGKWHLTQLMTPRLERMASILGPGGNIHRGSDHTLLGHGLPVNGQFLNGQNQHLRVLGSSALDLTPGAEAPMLEFATNNFFDYNMAFGLPAMFSFDSGDGGDLDSMQPFWRP